MPGAHKSSRARKKLQPRRARPPPIPRSYLNYIRSPPHRKPGTHDNGDGDDDYTTRRPSSVFRFNATTTITTTTTTVHHRYCLCARKCLNYRQLRAAVLLTLHSAFQPPGGRWAEITTWKIASQTVRGGIILCCTRTIKARLCSSEY